MTCRGTKVQSHTIHFPKRDTALKISLTLSKRIIPETHQYRRIRDYDTSTISSTKECLWRI